MDGFQILGRHNWGDLLLLAFTLLLVYVLLQFGFRLLQRVDILGRWQPAIKRLAHTLLLVFEPLAVLLLAGHFILIDPWLHGLILGLLLVGGFAHIRNYLSGRIVQFDPAVAVGRSLSTPQFQGIITATERLGVRLQSSQGVHFVDYTNMLSQGYTLLAGDEIGGFYQLEIRAESEINAEGGWHLLTDQLATVPYFNWWHKPEWTTDHADPKQLNARIAIHDEKHLHDFIALLNEWGYTCKIAKI